MSDLYATLGVSPSATGEEIKKSYRKLARQLHPDVNPGKEEAFKAVTAAYETLSDPQKRAQYDRGGSTTSAAGAGFSFTDIMDAFFGGGGESGPRSRQRRGQDALIRVQIDLRDAVFGGEREITVDTAVGCTPCAGSGAEPGTGTRSCAVCGGRGQIQQMQRSFMGNVMTTRPCGTCQGYGTVIASPCVQCSGDGRVRSRRTLPVRIPAGVDSGNRIQLTGEGEVGAGNGPAGDLYIEIAIAPDSTFVRRGNDLHATVEIPMTAAALGTVLSLNTLDGPHEVDIIPGSQSGQSVTLRGLGVTKLRGSGRGDLIVHFEVVTPRNLDDAQRELLHQLAVLRGEERPEGRLSTHGTGLFGRLKDAISGR